MRLSPLAAFVLPHVSEALSGSDANGDDVLSEMSIPRKRVAIIGAGAGGSSTAYHLSQLAESSSTPLDITVYERNSYIGGRTTTVDAWDDPHTPIELGGSIFVSVNHILVNATRDFGLSTKDLDAQLKERDLGAEAVPELGIWNGKEFVVLLESGGDGWWEKAKLLWRYGLAPIKTNALMKEAVGRFLKMYDEAFPWKSLSKVVQDVDLVEVTGLTGEQYLKNNGIGERFAKEVIQASTRVNYASNLGLIHGLETMVCMATNGAMAIQGGNWQIFHHMLKSTSSTIHLNTTVTAVSKQADGTYQITTASGTTESFDTVVLAAPLQFSQLVIDPAPKHVPDQIPYVNLYVTLFATPYELDPAYFGLEKEGKVPQFVLTTLPEGESHGSDPDGVGSPGFFSISIVSRALNRRVRKNRVENIYKIFSAEPVSSEFLSKVLGKDIEEGSEVQEDGPVTWIHRKLWHSYPYEYPRVTFEEIKLDDGLWYTSGIEGFISTMETSALMGKNVASLIAAEWAKSESENQSKGEGLKIQGHGEWKFEGVAKDQKPLKAKL